jgi:MFS transporter, SP family, solute carrier family 2 (facilitated glucose transporter), member 3
MNAPEPVVFPGHSTLSWSVAVSAFAIGGPFGSILGGYLANVHGRKGAMLINSWVFVGGGLLMTVAPNIYLLALSRLIIGFASGIAMVVVPVYLGEIAPPTLRGTLGTCTQFAIVIGILASNLLAFPLATSQGWRWLFLITPLLSGLQLIASPYLVESPRWLLNRDEHSREARLTIQKLRAFRQDSDIEQEVQHYLFAAAKHKTAFTSAHSSGAIWDLLSARDVRILLVSSIVLQIAQQLSGINAVFYYSTTFFQGVIDNPLLGTTLIGIVNLLATILALGLMDNTPRRLLLLCSSAGMIVSMICITLALMKFLPPISALLALLVFVSSFAVGLGPIPWLIVAEMFDSKYVATAMSITCVINWLCNFLVGLSFPFFNQYLREWCFAPFCMVLVLTTAFIYVYLPETQGRSVADVYRMVTNNRPRSDTLEEFEEKMVEMPIIDAVEMLESADYHI